MHPRSALRRAAVPLVALVGLVPLLAACGGSDSAKPVSVAGVDLDGPPSRIVSLSPTATEMLFAIGAGDRVVAVDKYSNYPAGVPKEQIDAYQLNVEAVANHDPDLVILAGDTNKSKAALEKLDIPVLIEPAATKLGEVYAQIRELGVVTGHRDDAEKLIDHVTAEVNDIKASAPSRPLTYYYELDPTYYSVATSTFIGQLLKLLGLRSIADEAQPANGGYPQLSAEYIVKADPDLIVLADTKCCGQTAATLAARPGWSGLKAVAGHGVVGLDDDIASRWGPRITVLLRKVADAAARVDTAEAATPAESEMHG